MPSCFVPGCKNSDKRKKPGITYHVFPKRLKVEWLRAIGKDEQTFIIQQRVCSDHFLNDDFERLGMLKKLKPSVIPSLNLPTPRPEVSTTTTTTSQVMPETLTSSQIPSATITVAPGEVPKLVAVREYLQSLPTESEMILLHDEAPATDPLLLPISASSDSGSQTYNPSGSGGEAKQKWKHFDLICFLAEENRPRDTLGNINRTHSSTSDDSSLPETPSPQLNPSKRQKKCDETDKLLMDISKEPAPKPTPAPALSPALLTVQTILDKLPLRVRMQAEIEILNKVYSLASKYNDDDQ